MTRIPLPEERLGTADGGPDTEPLAVSTRAPVARDRARAVAPWLFGALVLVGMLGLQTQLYSGQVRVMSAVFMFVALAQCWNVLGGFAGYASFGHVVFFGLGGYCTAVLMVHLQLSFWIALPISGLLAGAFATLIGLPLLRLKGHYFAIATLGVAEGVREIVINLPRLTGGGAGISVPVTGTTVVTPYLGNDNFYVLFLLLAGLATGAVGLLSRSRFGYALKALNQDEDAAGAIGINTTQSKVVAFALSGFLTGLVGAAYAFQQVAIYPYRLFDVEFTVLMVVMVVIGGSGTVIGPVIGAAGLHLLSEWLRAHVTDGHAFLLGGIIIIAVVLMPQGFVHFVREAWRVRRLPLLDTVRMYRL